MLENACFKRYPRSSNLKAITQEEKSAYARFTYIRITIKTYQIRELVCRFKKSILDLIFVSSDFMLEQHFTLVVE